MDGLSWRAALAIGFAQAVALAPGTSRSGITITAGRVLGLTRGAAARFSFLLLAPVTFGAVLFEGVDVARTGLPPGSVGPVSWSESWPPASRGSRRSGGCCATCRRTATTSSSCTG